MIINEHQREHINNDCIEILENKTHDLVFLKNTKIVIIGGTGFLGSWIAELVLVLNLKHSFSIKLYIIANDIDNFKESKQHLCNHSFIELINSDVRSLIDLPSDADYIINAASSPDTRIHASKPFDTASIISDGIIKILNACLRLSNLRKIIHLSSGLIANPINKMQGISEKSSNIFDFKNDSSNIYQCSKIYSEALCNSARSQLRLPITILRPFNFMGPYQKLSSPWAHTSLLNDAINSRILNIKGDGEIVRSYLYGADAAFWTLKFLVSGNIGGVYNIGSDQPISLKELAKKISYHSGLSDKIKINHFLDNTKINKYFYPDLTLIKKEFSLTVTIPIDDSIKKTISWHRLK
ncbi:putative dTDP-glucose 4-6-dehydratase [beta proteobacterium KB13]|uniref:Putative dTDP-glucose 4-6-dehydratase n=1 Tax=beta proteobacterium KB13 TaxID=314607 RepID=B6BTH9_9PROT|nr:putative dTDP-glucose 4-6-dehydratase [beta proteobacterium KB13]